MKTVWATLFFTFFAVYAFGQRAELEKGCANEDVKACLELARLSSSAIEDDVPRDIPKAYRIYTQLCNANVAEACDSLGSMHTLGIVDAQGRECSLFRCTDNTKAATLSLKACELGWASACSNYAHSLEQGRGVAKDMERAIRFYKKACDANDSYGCARLSEIYLTTPYGKGISKADIIGLAKKGCTEEKGYGCVILGQDAERVERYGEAFEQYSKACDRNTSKGCFHVGRFLYLGLGLEINADKAGEFFEKSCQLGEVSGCSSLTFLYPSWRGNKALFTNEEIRGFFENACDAGIMQGCVALAMVYGDGIGVARDTALSNSYLEKALNVGGR
ncbi:MAG: tetratricopeptide repeat protein [Campylobacterales bacterium]